MGDLTTVAAVQAFLGAPATQDPALFQQLVSAASVFVEKLISRTIIQTVYPDDRYNGTGGDSLFIRQAPIVSVQSLSIYANDLSQPIVVPPAPSSVAGYGYTFDSDKGIIYVIGGVFSKGRRNISLAHTSGYPDATVTNENVNIPGVAPYTATLLQGQMLRAVTSLTFVVGGGALTLVGSNPASGQYTLSPGGVLGFAAADTGKALLCTYTTNGTPLDLSQAVVEMVAYKYGKRKRLDMKSETLATQTVAYDMSEVPVSAKGVLERYQRPFVLL